MSDEGANKYLVECGSIAGVQKADGPQDAAREFVKGNAGHLHESTVDVSLIGPAKTFGIEIDVIVSEPVDDEQPTG